VEVVAGGADADGMAGEIEAEFVDGMIGDDLGFELVEDPVEMETEEGGGVVHGAGYFPGVDGPVSGWWGQPETSTSWTGSMRRSSCMSE
jgi:hypothetical protein